MSDWYEIRAIKCDHCDHDAVVTLTAAYPTAARAAHPEWATYPAPMVRACAAHVLDYVMGDRNAPGATPGYLLRFIEGGAR